MDFSFLNNGNTPQTPIIQKDTDASKYEEISKKLCIKRKTLEQDLARTDLGSATREEYALKLIDIKETLQVFGISEIDYQAYLAKGDEDETTSQASLF